MNNSNTKQFVIVFCVLYTVYNLIVDFSGERLKLDPWKDKIDNVEIYSFWGWNTKTYGIHYDHEVDDWYIYHIKYTNGKKEYLNIDKTG